MLIGLVFLSQQTTAVHVKEIKRVLVIYEAGLSYPGVASFDRAIRETLNSSNYQIELYTENLEEILFSDQASQRYFRQEYIRKYRNRKPDLIIAEGPPSAEFIADSHKNVFSDVPVVVCCNIVDKPQIDSNSTGVWMTVETVKTLDLALQLFPRTKYVVVVGGTSPFDRQLEAIVREQTRNYEPRIKFTYLADLKTPELFETIRHLPIDTVILYTSFSEDADGITYIDATQLLPFLASAANAPFFVMFDSQVGHGPVGGDVFSYAAQGRVAAEMAIRILKGVSVKDVPVERLSNSYVFDWNALQRWGVKANKLPPGGIVLNREPSLWERGRKYFLSGIVVVILQALLICGLFWQRARKREAEAGLRESEKRFRLVANTAPVLIWMSGTDKLCTYFNNSWLEFTGRSFEAEYGNGWVEGVHPDDVQKCMEIYTQSFDQKSPFRMEYRLRRHDGVFRWVIDLGVARFNADGSFAGYIGSAIDVTDQKLAHEALQRVSGQLIEAQEKERIRIARELHDDVCQRLAMLLLKIEKAAQHRGGGQLTVAQQLKQIWQECSSLAGDVQALSHDLHPSILDNLGLDTAIQSYCREVAEQNGVVVELSSNLPRSLPRDVSLSVFRVVQEAVRNSVKYSGQEHVKVYLQEDSGKLELEVSDQGVGFDVTSTRNKNGGLGLVSMAERIYQVNGTLSIDSQPNAGTRIRACVPLAAQSSVTTAAPRY